MPHSDDTVFVQCLLAALCYVPVQDTTGHKLLLTPKSNTSCGGAAVKRREAGLSGPSGRETIAVLVKMKGELMPLKALLNSCWAPVNAASKGSSRSSSPYTLHFNHMPHTGSTRVPKQKRSNRSPSLALSVPTALFLV